MSRGALVVGVMPAARMPAVLRVVRRFARDHGLRPDVREVWARPQELARVALGDVDVVVLVGPVDVPGTVSRVIGHVPRVAVVPSGGEWHTRGCIELPDVIDLPTWRRPDGIDPTWHRAWLLDDERGGPPRVTTSRPVTDTEALITIATGREIGVAPQTWLTERPFDGCAAVPIVGLDPAPILALTPSPPTRLQRDFVRSLVDEMLPQCRPPTGLTPAERRVCDLVARGWTNKRIATELVVSPRTVDSQVSSALRKLGVDGRTELAVSWSVSRANDTGG